jgi:hypothetical protein
MSPQSVPIKGDPTSGLAIGLINGPEAGVGSGLSVISGAGIEGTSETGAAAGLVASMIAAPSAWLSGEELFVTTGCYLSWPRRTTETK